MDGEISAEARGSQRKGRSTASQLSSRVDFWDRPGPEEGSSGRVGEKQSPQVGPVDQEWRSGRAERSLNQLISVTEISEPVDHEPVDLGQADISEPVDHKPLDLGQTSLNQLITNQLISVR
jgi:hypothetical protein